MIPYGKQNIIAEDIAAVIETLESEWLTQGPSIVAFELAMASYCQSKYAVAVCNATSALHISCLALDVGAGDIVWTSPNTFIASANCAHYCGAKVDFVDIDPITLNLSITALEVKLELAKKSGRLPKVVIPVHFSGRSCEMKQIFELGQRYGFKIIEDASHAVGAEYDGRPVGSCQYSDISVFSFHPVKIITTGEGGMAMTNHAELARKLSRLRSHGICQSSEDLIEPVAGPWHYQQIELGYNYRMTNIQSALGISQLKRLPQFISRRRELAKRYHNLLSGMPLKTPLASDESSWHLYPIRVPSGKRLDVFNMLRSVDIWVQVHYKPVHTQPYYRYMGFNYGDFPESELYYSEAFSLPLYYDLSDADQDQVVTQLKKSLS